MITRLKVLSAQCILRISENRNISVTYKRKPQFMLSRYDFLTHPNTRIFLSQHEYLFSHESLIRTHDKANDVLLFLQELIPLLGLVHKLYNGRSIKIDPAWTKPSLNPATLFALTSWRHPWDQYTTAFSKILAMSNQFGNTTSTSTSTVRNMMGKGKTLKDQSGLAPDATPL